jgi:hypothetical protein
MFHHQRCRCRRRQTFAADLKSFPLYGQEEVIEQVEGGLGGRGGVTLGHQKLGIHRYEGCEEALAGSDYHGGSIA